MALRWLHENRSYIVAACVAGLLMAITVRLIAETASGHHKDTEYIMGQMAALDARMTKLETSTHPATTKRYTSDMAAADKSLYLGEIARLDATIAAHLKQESQERAAHDLKCRNRWLEVGQIKADLAAIKDASNSRAVRPD